MESLGKNEVEVRLLRRRVFAKALVLDLLALLCLTGCADFTRRCAPQSPPMEGLYRTNWHGIWHYLRFYPDGTLLSVVSKMNPESAVQILQKGGHAVKGNPATDEDYDEETEITSACYTIENGALSYSLLFENWYRRDFGRTVRFHGGRAVGDKLEIDLEPNPNFPEERGEHWIYRNALAPVSRRSQ